MLNFNTYNYLTVHKQMIDMINYVQTNDKYIIR